MTCSAAFDRNLTTELKEAAQAEGFVRAGVAAANVLTPEGEQLDAWLRDGYHGQMAWMARTSGVRKDPRHDGMLPGAQSVLVLAAPYPRTGEVTGPSPSRVAKYALGRDYHNVLTKKGRKLQKRLQAAGHTARVAVDSKPVFERAWAERAGLGFVGKNCCLIVPGLGSHVFLVCIVTSAPLVPDAPMERRCGSCTLCLDACPTKAFDSARRLDARKCISYLTIEHKGSVPKEHRRGLGPWLFGCDVCQDVCPYNHTSASTDLALKAFQADDSRWGGLDAVGVLQMDAERFAEWAQGSPLKRAGLQSLRRNAALVLGNQGDASHLTALREAADGAEEASVREAAEWAVSEIRLRQAEPASPQAPTEEDPDPHGLPS